MTAMEDCRVLLQQRLVQRLGLVVFLTVVGALSFSYKLTLLDPDTWWHLKVGDWIIEHTAVPHTGILSRTAANRPWVAYSWGYELLLSRAYAWFGLAGIGVFGALLTIGVAYGVYWMMRRLSGRFWLAVVGASIVSSAFLFDGSPRPFFVSIALYGVMLALLLEANRSGRVPVLYWLPLIFLVWANIHVQFIYGLFVLGLFVGVNVMQRLLGAAGIAPGFLQFPSLPAAHLLGIFAACVLATLIGPNFYHPYIAVYQYTQAKFPYSVIVELQPLSFRLYSNLAELLLAAAGFYAVGWQKKIEPFKLALLAVAAVVAFRTMRDAWFICLSAAACVADFPATDSQRDPVPTWLGGAGVAAVTAVLLLAISSSTDFNQRGLDRTISATYPVNAINFLRRNPVPGPLYNNLNWGGFLMWYMPDTPVAIDGRNDLYGDDLDRMFYDTQNAAKSYETDPYLNEAGVILLDSTLPLAKILTVDPRFRLIYRDQIATVYARR